MKIRIKFRKVGNTRFIGHLDMMRYFQKAIRRADIDIVYTEGFSPHQVMSFAAPLGVGIISEGEYLDIEVHTSKSSQNAMQALNAVMAEGIEIIDYIQLPKETKKAMASVAGAEYELFLKHPENPEGLTFSELQEILSLYLNREKIMITKQSKKGERTIDLKPHIHKLEAYHRLNAETDAEEIGFHMFLSAGSEENIKPELVAADVYEFSGRTYPQFSWQIRRVDVFAKDENGSFVPLSAFGSPIPEEECSGI